jgi:protein-S-isoprenylcysteine O-methyltransferase Ste14
MVLILAGGVIISPGLVSLQRRARAPSLQDTLVSHEIYAYVHRPLYSGMILELAGFFLWVPTVNVLIACILGMIWVMIQAKLEDMDLVERLPVYKVYMQRVPRFLPRIRHSKLQS